MRSDWVRVGWKEGQFIVAYKTGRDISRFEDECIVVRQFINPKDALEYAAALMDGIKIANGGPFILTDWLRDVMVVQEAGLAMTDMLMQLNKEQKGGR